MNSTRTSQRLPWIGVLISTKTIPNSDADFFNEDVYGDFPEEVAEDENANLPIDDGDAEAVADNQDYAHFDNDIAISDTCNNESSDNFNDDVDYTEGY